MAKAREIIDAVKNAETANAAAPHIAKINHALTSKTEIKDLWAAKIKELGLIYDKAAKRYADPENKDGDV